MYSTIGMWAAVLNLTLLLGSVVLGASGSLTLSAVFLAISTYVLIAYGRAREVLVDNNNWSSLKFQWLILSAVILYRVSYHHVPEFLAWLS